ncbi:MAG TPA: ABC transporter substrate-binding protein, partial [Nocardioides sp.]|nr:ABC transporter substrate-binding protein [Nocardioides sp.]
MNLKTLAAAVAGTVLLAGCGAASGNEDAVGDDGTVDLSQVTLIVGDQKGTSARALLTAAGLEDTPYEIEWKEFTSGPPILEALNSDAIHVGMVGNTPPIFAAAAGGTFKM